MRFEKPKSNEPGYLNRLMKADKFRKFISGSDSEGDFIELLCDYALPYIIEPVDRDKAKQELLEASEDEYKELMQFIASGGAENPTAPEKKETS